jgi:hypothetical protein
VTLEYESTKYAAPGAAESVCTPGSEVTRTMDDPSSFATKTWRSRGSAVVARNQTVPIFSSTAHGPSTIHAPFVIAFFTEPSGEWR